MIGHQKLTAEVKFMRRPITIKHKMEKLASHSGLIDIGALLEAINFRSRFNTISRVHCVEPKIPHGDILASMIALISIGKPDYDAIEIFREKQDFFNKAIGINACPSSPTLRQRIDLIGSQADGLIKDVATDLIQKMRSGNFAHPNQRRRFSASGYGCECFRQFKDTKAGRFQNMQRC